MVKVGKRGLVCHVKACLLTFFHESSIQPSSKALGHIRPQSLEPCITARMIVRLSEPHGIGTRPCHGLFWELRKHDVKSSCRRPRETRRYGALRQGLVKLCETLPLRAKPIVIGHPQTSSRYTACLIVWSDIDGITPLPSWLGRSGIRDPRNLLPETYTHHPWDCLEETSRVLLSSRPVHLPRLEDRGRLGCSADVARELPHAPQPGIRSTHVRISIQARVRLSPAR